jgi:hypothetical protein
MLFNNNKPNIHGLSSIAFSAAVINIKSSVTKQFKITNKVGHVLEKTEIG